MHFDPFAQTVAEIRILAAIITKTATTDLEQRLASAGSQAGSLQHGILRLLFVQTATIAELSGMMRVKPATLVPAVDALEKAGLVKRGADPADRRRIPLTLTKRGAALLERVPEVQRDDALFQGVAKLGVDHCATLLSLLRELVGELPDGRAAVEGIAAARAAQAAPKTNSK